VRRPRIAAHRAPEANATHAHAIVATESVRTAAPAIATGRESLEALRVTGPLNTRRSSIRAGWAVGPTGSAMLGISQQVPLAASSWITIAVAESGEAVKAAGSAATRGDGIGRSRTDRSADATIAEVLTQVSLASVTWVPIAVSPPRVTDTKRACARDTGRARTGEGAAIAADAAVIRIDQDGCAHVAAERLTRRAGRGTVSKIANLASRTGDRTRTTIQEIGRGIDAHSSAELMGRVSCGRPTLEAETGPGCRV
jgi:hypothetical protein